MFIIESPWFALGFITLLIPIIIHLFNKSRGRLIKIGHIALIRQAKKLTVNEIKLKQWILLLLRLAIFALASFILMNIAINQKDEDNTQQYYALDPNWVALANDQQLTEMLLTTAKGNIEWLAPNFEVLNRELVNGDLTLLRTLAKEQTRQTLSLWSLITERSSSLAQSDTLNVYSAVKNNDLQTILPAMSANVNFQFITPNTSVDIASPKIALAIISENSNPAVALEIAVENIKTHLFPNITRQNFSSLAEFNALTTEFDIVFNLMTNEHSEQFNDAVRKGLIVVTESDENRLNSSFEENRAFEKYSITEQFNKLFQKQSIGLGTLYQSHFSFDHQLAVIPNRPEFIALLLELFHDAALINAANNVQISVEQLGINQVPQTSVLLKNQNKTPLSTLLVGLLIIFWCLERALSEVTLRDK